MNDKKLRIVFPVYQGLTQLDFTAPHQVLSRLPGAELMTAAVGGGVIVADDGLRVVASKLEKISHCDIVCVPGGPTCTEAMLNEEYLALIQRLAQTATYVTSVCTGSLILGAAGLLRGRRATSHWAWRDFLPLFGAEVDTNRVVRDGNIITGSGVTAGIDFALTLIAEVAGKTLAQAIQLGIEYAPAPPFDCGRPDLASAAIKDAVQTSMDGFRAARTEAIERAAFRFNRTRASA